MEWVNPDLTRRSLQDRDSSRSLLQNACGGRLVAAVVPDSAVDIQDEQLDNLANNPHVVDASDVELGVGSLDNPRPAPAFVDATDFF
jgi:hypothetical protein